MMRALRWILLSLFQAEIVAYSTTTFTVRTCAIILLYLATLVGVG
jgi:hypothetical protein